MHEKDLQAMKVSQLKIKCKELKVPNFSKLTKAELVQRILDTETHSNRTQHAVQYDKKSSPSTVSHPKDESKKLQACQPDRRQIGGDTTISPDTIVAEEAGETHGATPQAGDIARYRQMSSTTLPGVLSTKMTSKMTTSTAHADGPTTASALLKTKGASFKAPTPKLLPQQSPLKSLTDSRPQEYTHTLNSALDRVAYIRSHFISRLLHTLNRHRSMSPPPSSAPKAENDCAYGTTKELSFQGFESGIYHTGSADDFCVALRFWISRLHVLMQLGCGEAWSTFGGGLGLLTPDLAKWPVVAGCKRISRDFWLIQTNESLTCKSGMISFIVFGLTGEVLATSTDHRRENSIEGCPVRNDWYNFIVDSPMEASIADGLLNRIKTKNVEEFPGGISRAWRRRRSDSGTGDERLLIAQRVAVASCALNSVSGMKRSAIQMDAEWLGYYQATITKQARAVEMYLPESIQVMSIHVPPPPFHSALAIVHRSSGQSDYVLKDTGQVIGEEHEGVVPLWQGLLGCSDKGVNDVKQSEEFWVGWEDRTWG